MRNIFLASMFALSLTASSALAESATFPERKAGLWQLTVTDSTGATPSQTSEQCIDKETDAKLMQSGMGIVNSMCSKNESRNESGKFITESTCNVMGSEVTSRSVTSGDFSSSYVTEVTSKNNPPLMGQAGSNMKITAKYLGACKAGQKPGEMILANGMKINPLEALDAANNAQTGKAMPDAETMKKMTEQAMKAAAEAQKNMGK